MANVERQRAGALVLVRDAGAVANGPGRAGAAAVDGV